MKKFVTLMLVLAASYVANAAYMFWQIEESPEGMGAEYATMYAYNRNTGAYTALTSTWDGGSATLVPVDYWNEYTVDLSQITLGDGETLADYSFIIELKNGNDSNSEVVGYGDFQTYESMGQYISSTGSLSDITTVTPWHEESFAAPEPTSGLLMLLGAACLGLRRKARSAA